MIEYPKTIWVQTKDDIGKRKRYIYSGVVTQIYSGTYVGEIYCETIFHKFKTSDLRYIAEARFQTEEAAIAWVKSQEKLKRKLPFNIKE